MSTAPDRDSGCSTPPVPTRSRRSRGAENANDSRAATPNTIATFSSALKVKRRGRRPNGSRITLGKSTICARRSTGPFSPGGDGSIGVALTAAVPLWMRLSLLEGCRGRAEQALAALGAGASRDARPEMKLHAAVGASLIYSRGAAGPETSMAYTRALEIAESLDDAEYRLRSLWGLWAYHSASGRHRVALELAQRFHASAAERPDPNDRLSGEGMIGVSQHYLGDLPSARRHLGHVR